MPKYKLFLHLAVLFTALSFVPAAASQSTEACTVLISDIEGASTHLRNRNERIEDLDNLIQEIVDDGITANKRYEMMYWAAMAESAALRSEVIEYPDCTEYNTLNTVFMSGINDIYALAAQSDLIEQGQLTEFQQGNVSELLKSRASSLLTNIRTWKSMYSTVQELG